MRPTPVYGVRSTHTITLNPAAERDLPDEESAPAEQSLIQHATFLRKVEGNRV